MRSASLPHFGIDITVLRLDSAKHAVTETLTTTIPLSPATCPRTSSSSRASFERNFLGSRSESISDVNISDLHTVSLPHVAIDTAENESASSTAHTLEIQIEVPVTEVCQSAGAALQTDIFEGRIRNCLKMAGAVACFAIPPVMLLGGLGLLADGIRRRVQAGGFSDNPCPTDGNIKLCDSYLSDHQSKVAYQEIFAGSFITAAGGIATTSYAWLIRNT